MEKFPVRFTNLYFRKMFHATYIQLKKMTALDTEMHRPSQEWASTSRNIQCCQEFIFGDYTSTIPLKSWSVPLSWHTLCKYSSCLELSCFGVTNCSDSARTWILSDSETSALVVFLHSCFFFLLKFPDGHYLAQSEFL